MKITDKNFDLSTWNNARKIQQAHEIFVVNESKLEDGGSFSVDGYNAVIKLLKSLQNPNEQELTMKNYLVNKIKQIEILEV